MYRRAHESPINRAHNRSQHIEYERRCTPTRAHTVHQPNKLKVAVDLRRSLSNSSLSSSPHSPQSK
jgi:hypothetical protein